MQIRRHSGFTLLEVLVTVSVFSILMALAIPSFRGMMDRNAVTAAANDILSSILLARSEAVKRETTVTFVVSDNSWAVKNGDEEIAVSSAPPGVSVDNLTLSYNPRGRAQTGSIGVTKNEITRYVCISTTGRPRVQENECT